MLKNYLFNLKITVFFVLLSQSIGLFSEDVAPANSPAAADSVAPAAIISQIKEKETALEKAQADTVSERFNWGVANLEKVRNMTTSYTDIFYDEQKGDIGSALPNNSIIQIATLRTDLKETADKKESEIPSAGKILAGIADSLSYRQLEATAQANLKILFDWMKGDANLKLSEVKSVGAFRDLVQGLLVGKDFETKFAGKLVGKKEDFAKNLSAQAVTLVEPFFATSKEESPYRFYAARNLFGAWRLVADTTDPSDPATNFIVEHYRDGLLNDWLGVRAQAQDNLYLAAQANNSVMLSSDKFARDEAKDAHWKLSGTNLSNCGLVNRAIGGFLSCRDLSDEKKLDKFWFDPKTGGDLSYTDYEIVEDENEDSPGFWTVAKEPRAKEGKIGRATTVDEPLFYQVERISSFFYKLINFHVKRYLKTVGGMDDTAKADANRDFVLRDAENNAYKPHELLMLASKCRGFLKTTQNEELKARCNEAIKKIANETKASFNRIATKEKRDICYGDKIKIISLKTLNNLYGKKGAHSAKPFKDAGDFNKGRIVCSTDYDDSADNLKLEENESWWVIKGPHKKGDPFNAQVGLPVKNGDVVRLENLSNKMNLHCTKNDISDLSSARIFAKNYATTLYGENGDGDSFDNWVISFSDSTEQNLFAGQTFELKSQNAGFRLVTNQEKKYFMQGSSGDMVEFATAVDAKAGDDSIWTIDSYSKGSLPIENVAWTGVPYGAAATDIGSKENIKINIVKLGMGGGIAPNNTLEIKVNVQDKKPMVAGFAKEAVPGFEQGFLINLSALFDKGIGWISESFEHEGRASASFLIRAGDSGNAQVVLGNNMTLDYTYKFVIGANENTETQLIRRDFDSGGRPQDTIVAKVSKKDNPLAALRSGVFAPYWISVNNGTVMLGVSDEIGENVLLIWRDPNPRNQVSRIGFGSDLAPVDFTNVQIGDALEISAPEMLYAQSKQSEDDLGASAKSPKDFNDFKDKVGKGKTFPEDITFRVPGRGSIGFSVKGSQELTLKVSTVGTSNKPNGQDRYVLKLYGQNLSQNFEQRFYAMAEYLNQLIILVDEKLTSEDDPASAVEKIRKAVPTTFSKLPVESIEQIQAAIKSLSRDFESWSTFKSAFSDVKSRLAALNLIVASGSKADSSAVKTSIGFIESAQTKGDALKVFAYALFKKLRQDLSIKAIEKRDEIGSVPVKDAKEAIVVMLEQIFANPQFDLEGRPVCVLERFNKKTGNLEKVGMVLESDMSLYSDFAKIPKDSYRKYWINFSQGRIYVGSGEFGENLFFYNWDKEPQDDFVQISFESTGQTKIRDFFVGPELAITRSQKMEAYKQAKQLFNFKGDFQVILPYKYRLSQEGASVKFKDELTGKTYYPGKVPQKGALYYFMLILQENGFPQLVWSREPENQEKLSLDKKAYIKKAESDALFQASTYVQGMGVIGGLIGVGASVAYSAIGVASGQEAGQLQAKSTFDYKSHDSYVYIDQEKTDKLVNSSIPQEAQVNQANFQKNLSIGGNWIGDASKIGLLIPHFRKVLSLITHPFVVSNQSDKSLLFSYLTSLFNTHKKTYENPQMQVDNTYTDLIQLFMAAYNNRYLINQNNKDEAKVRNDWYAKANELAREILKKDPEHSIKLDPMYGEYVWLNDTLDKLGEGSITFKAIGQNDAMICFASQPEQVRNTTKQIYEVSLGSWDNTKAVIRAKSLGKTVAESSSQDLKCKIVDAGDASTENQYWISVNKGKIYLGKGNLDPKNAIGKISESGTIERVEWKDPVLKTNLKVKALIDAEKDLLQIAKGQKVTSDMATFLTTEPFDSADYKAFIDKQKAGLPADKYPESLKIMNAIPETEEEYQTHLTSLISKIGQELAVVLTEGYKPVVSRLEAALDKDVSKDLYNFLKTIPGSTDKYSEHLSKVLTDLQKELPIFLDQNPAYEYDTVGSYSVEPFNWQDPYPINNLKYVGISSWDAPIEFSKITVGPKVEDFKIFRDNLIAKIRTMRGEPLSAVVEIKEAKSVAPAADASKPK